MSEKRFGNSGTIDTRKDASNGADASDPVAARRRRQARTDGAAKHTYSYTRDDAQRLDMGVKTGLGLFGRPKDEPGPDDGDAEKARARRLARNK